MDRMQEGATQYLQRGPSQTWPVLCCLLTPVFKDLVQSPEANPMPVLIGEGQLGSSGFCSGPIHSQLPGHCHV